MQEEDFSKEEEEAKQAEEQLAREEAEAEAALEAAKKEELEAKLAEDTAAREMYEAVAAEKKAKREREEADEAQAEADKEMQEATAAQQQTDIARSAVQAFNKGPLTKAKNDLEVALSHLEGHEERKLQESADHHKIHHGGSETRHSKISREDSIGNLSTNDRSGELDVITARTNLEKAEKRYAELLEELKTGEESAKKELAEAEAAAKNAETERIQAERAERQAAVERQEALEAKEAAEVEKAEAIAARAQAQKEVDEVAEAKAVAARERAEAEQARQVAEKERAEADEAADVAAEKQQEAAQARSKYYNKVARRLGVFWRDAAKRRAKQRRRDERRVRRLELEAKQANDAAERNGVGEVLYSIAGEVPTDCERWEHELAAEREDETVTGAETLLQRATRLERMRRDYRASLAQHKAAQGQDQRVFGTLPAVRSGAPIAATAPPKGSPRRRRSSSARGIERGWVTHGRGGTLSSVRAVGSNVRATAHRWCASFSNIRLSLVVCRRKE